MGQVNCSDHHGNMGRRDRLRGNKSYQLENFPDLVHLPPEVAVQVLSYLDATDLCLASCVNELWCSLTNVEPLWKG